MWTFWLQLGKILLLNLSWCLSLDFHEELSIHHRNGSV